MSRLTFTTPQGESAHMWLLPDPDRPVVILCAHGVELHFDLDQLRDLVAEASRLHELGRRVTAPGKSEGKRWLIETSDQAAATRALAGISSSAFRPS